VKKGQGSVLLAAGGTGGHLFPAQALAEELNRRDIPVDLVTDMRGDRYGTGFPARQVYQVPAATLAGRSPAAMARTAYLLTRGLAAAYLLLGKVRPGVVVGFGGYPTFPPLKAASLRGIPTVLHEQNAVLGRANRMLAKSVSCIATSFEQTKLLGPELQAKARLTGNPVRSAVIEAAQRPYRRLEPGGTIDVLVFGGSQGARFFSEAVPPALALLPEELRRRLRIVQQARPEDLDAVVAAYRASGIGAEVAAFFKDLPERMAKAQLVVGRSGASTVAELTVVGRPSILVPLPHALDNDQLQNAARLAESGAAWCIQQKELSAEGLARDFAALFNDPDKLAAAAAAAQSLGRPDAVERLADLVEEFVRPHHVRWQPAP
jgi:UDP-N-acetylglucosamine--N-acetylmuramyl-(pentapeptide) pyrophosphoryl-undecaprenol N-acetylglucosamine transferase